MQAVGQGHYVAYWEAPAGSTELWRLLWPCLQQRLPLKDVQWRTKTGTTKIVNRVPLQFLRHNDPLLQFTPSPSNCYRDPFLCILLIPNDDSNKRIKVAVKEWVASMQHQHQFLVVVVSQSAPSSRAISLGRVFDKLRGDMPKREKVCEIVIESKNEEQWEDLFNKMKECITASFEHYVALSLAEIKKLDQQRLNPGWNYCSFFLLKESLAFIYERAQIFEYAVLLYQEMDALLSKDQKSNDVWNAISGTSTATLLSWNDKDYRDLMASNKISKFDISQYLFARQAAILFEMDEATAVATKADEFINSMKQELLTRKELPSLFVEAWVYSACCFVADECKKRGPPKPAPATPARALSVSSVESSQLQQVQLQPSHPPAAKRESPYHEFHFTLGNLYFHARTQLGRMATVCGLYSTYGIEELFCEASDAALEPADSGPSGVNKSDDGKSSSDSLLSSTPPSQDPLTPTPIAAGKITTSGRKLSKKTPRPAATPTVVPAGVSLALLVDALQSQEAFDRVFLDLTIAALEEYKLSERIRSVDRLNREIALFYFKRKQWADAEPRLKQVVRSYMEEGWHELAYHVLSMLAHCHRLLQRHVDFVETCLWLLSPRLPVDEQERLLYTDQLFSFAAKNLPTETEKDLRPVFTPSLDFPARTFSLGSLVCVRCTIISSLPKAIKADAVAARLIRWDDQLSKFVEADNIVVSLPAHTLYCTYTYPKDYSNGIDIVPGINQFELMAEPFLIGVFRCDRLWITIGKMTLSEILDPESTLPISLTPSLPTLTLESRIPRWLPVGDSMGIQEVCLRVSPHHDRVLGGSISFSSTTSLFLAAGPLPPSIVTSPDGTQRSQSLEVVDNAVHLFPMSPHEIATIFLSLPPQPESCTHQLMVNLTYTKSTKEIFPIQKEIFLSFTYPFILSAPRVIPNFEGCLISMQAQCTAGVPLNIIGYSLAMPSLESRAEDWSNADPSVTSQLILPQQEYSFLFKLLRSPYVLSSWSLSIEYEIGDQSGASKIDSAIPATKHFFTHVVDIATTKHCYQMSVEFPRKAFVGSSILLSFTISRDASHTDVELPEACLTDAQEVPSADDELNNDMESLQAIMAQQSETDTTNTTESVTELVPAANDSEQELSSSQPELTSRPPTARSKHQYEIREDPALWLVCGRKRLTFNLQPGESISHSVTIVAVQPGYLPVPNVVLLGVPSTQISVLQPASHIWVFPESSMLYSCQATDS